MVSAIANNMADDVADCTAQLHDQAAPELDDADEFMETLRAQFEDTSQGQEAEAEIKEFKQRGHPIKELVLEFWRVVGKL